MEQNIREREGGQKCGSTRSVGENLQCLSDFATVSGAAGVITLHLDK